MKRRRVFRISSGLVTALALAPALAACSSGGSSDGGDGASSAFPECPSGTATLATIDPKSDVVDIAVDANNVYVLTRDGELTSVPRCGGALTSVAKLGNAAAFAIDGANAYASAGAGTIKRVALAGGAVTEIDTGLRFVRTIASDGTTLYFTGTDGGPDEDDNDDDKAAFGMVPIAGGAATVLAHTESSSGYGAIAIDDTHVFWADQGSPGGYTGFLMKMPRGGGEQTRLSSDTPSFVTALTVHGDSLYGASQAGPVYRIPRAGGASQQLASNINNARSVAVSGGQVYWTNAFTGTATIYNLPTSGGAEPTKLREENPAEIPRLVAFQRSVFYALMRTDGAFHSKTLESTIVRYTP